MHDPGDGAYVDQAVEHLPTPAAQAPDPARRGREGQRRHGDEAQKSRGNERPLPHIFGDFVEIEELVQPQICGEVQASVEEGEQAQHAPKANQLGQAQQAPQRRDSQCDGQKAQRPVAGGMRDEFDGVRAQVLVEGLPGKQQQRRQTEEEDGDLEPSPR